MRARWFGEPWPERDRRAPVCSSEQDKVETPVGERCLVCGEAIEEGDRGIVMGANSRVGHTFLMKIDGRTRSVGAEHIDCALTAIVGQHYVHDIARRA